MTRRRGCSKCFAAEQQGLRQECVLVLLLFSIFFAEVVNEAYMYFKADKDIMDAREYPRKKTGAVGRGKQTPESTNIGESTLETSV